MNDVVNESGLQKAEAPKPLTEGAPGARPEQFQLESNYHAALIKKGGKEVTPGDFMDSARRAWGIADNVFHGVTAELNKDRYAVEGETGQFHEGYLEKGAAVDLESLTPEQLDRLMKESGSLVLDLKPAAQDPRVESGWVQMKWEKGQGDRIIFYGQSHDATKPRFSKSESYVADALYTEMFPDGKAPVGFDVKQGIRDASDADKKLSPKQRSSRIWSILRRKDSDATDDIH